MFTRAFWAAALERALKSGAQAVILLWGVGEGMFSLWTVDAKLALGAFLGGVVLSVLTSVVSSPLSGNPGPSLGPERIPTP